MKMWNNVKEWAVDRLRWAHAWALTNPAVGHGLLALLVVLFGGWLGAPFMFASFIAGFYWGREMMQAKILTTGETVMPWDWSRNPTGIAQAAVPTAVGFGIASLWLF
jgi:hypothetical protein